MISNLLNIEENCFCDSTKYPMQINDVKIEIFIYAEKLNEEKIEKKRRLLKPKFN